MNDCTESMKFNAYVRVRGFCGIYEDQESAAGACCMRPAHKGSDHTTVEMGSDGHSVERKFHLDEPS